MSFSFDNRPCYDPHELARWCFDNQLPADLFRLKTNTYFCPLGFRPGTGKLLMRLGDVEAMRLTDAGDKLRALVITDPVSRVPIKFPSMLVAGDVEAASPGIEKDADTVYVVSIADKRWLYWQRGEPIAKSYNLRSKTDGSYCSGTLNAGTPWTWQQIISDLWPADLGAAPTLPFTPDGTPEGLWYHDVSRFEAIEHVVTRIACAGKYDPVKDAFSIVRLGDTASTTGAAATSAYAKFAGSQRYDNYPALSLTASYPAKIRVEFAVKAPYCDGRPPFYTIDNTVQPSAAPFAAGTYLMLEDDLIAVSDGNGASITNGAALTARSTERYNDWLRKRQFFDTGRLRVYAGAIDFTAALGSLVSGVCWHSIATEEARGGVRTELRAGPIDGAEFSLEHWRRPSPTYDGMGPCDCCDCGACCDPLLAGGASIGDGAMIGDSGNGCGPCATGSGGVSGGGGNYKCWSCQGGLWVWLDPATQALMSTTDIPCDGTETVPPTGGSTAIGDRVCSVPDNTPITIPYQEGTGPPGPGCVIQYQQLGNGTWMPVWGCLPGVVSPSGGPRPQPPPGGFQAPQPPNTGGIYTPNGNVPLGPLGGGFGGGAGPFLGGFGPHMLGDGAMIGNGEGIGGYQAQVLMPLDLNGLQGATTGQIPYVAANGDFATIAPGSDGQAVVFIGGVPVAGTPSGGGIVATANQSADAANTSTGETDLYTNTLAAGYFASNGVSKLIAEYAGIAASNGNVKTIRVYVAGTVCATLSVSGTQWAVRVIVIRVSSSVLRVLVMTTAAASTSSTYTEVTGLTLSNTQIVKVTGQGGATSDLVAKLATLYPAA